MPAPWNKSDDDGRIQHSIEIGEGRVRAQWWDTCPSEMANMGYDQRDFPLAEFLIAGSAGQVHIRGEWGEAILAEVVTAAREAAAQPAKSA
jgi:hypothetical protein